MSGVMGKVVCDRCGHSRPTTAPHVFDGEACPEKCGGTMRRADRRDASSVDEATARMELYPTTGRRVEHRGRHIAQDVAGPEDTAGVYSDADPGL